jgi:DNA-binding response OmpR family regulator
MMRVLVAEDERVSQRMLVALLKRWGYTPVAVVDGNAALDAMQAPDAPRLALLDWIMPGLSGPEICRALRQTERDEPPYIILITAHEKQSDVVAGLEAGANDYVIKPYDPDELRARVAVGKRVVSLQADLARRIRELSEALAHVRTLQGILPICMYCHKIRNDQESWDRMELYIAEHSDAEFSHGICPECMLKYHSDLLEDDGEADG